MKKAKKTTPSPSHNDKGFLALAGEAFSVLGEEIAESKDKLVEAASEKFTSVKKAIKKITKKKPIKKAIKKAARKSAVKPAKKAIKKAVKKAVKKTVKKVSKKAPPAKKKKK